MTKNLSGENYQHTQSGTWILVTMSGLAVVFITSAFLTHTKPMLIPVPIMLAIGWLFHSLTIDITDGELRWKFGPGFIRKSVPLAEVVSAAPAKNGPSWGIHWSPRTGWLYNVSGLDAVAVTLQDGRKFMLGTDEPAVLVEAIRNRIK